MTSKIQSPKVYAVVLMWNQSKATIACIRSLQHSTWNNLYILIVDNNSDQIEHQYVESSCSEVCIITLLNNSGVSHAYNVGAKFAFDQGADYVLLLNNDTEVTPNTIENLIELLLQLGPDHSVISPAIYYKDRKEDIWSLGGHWRSATQTIQLITRIPLGMHVGNLLKTQFLTGCCLLVGENVWKIVGGFDETFSFYYEDWDFSLCCQRKNIDLWCALDIKLFHVVGASSIKRDDSKSTSYLYAYIMGQNGYTFYRKHFSFTSLLISSIWIAIRAFVRLHFIFGIGYINGVCKAIRNAHNHKNVTDS